MLVKKRAQVNSLFFRIAMSKVLINGDSHLKRIGDVFRFPDKFTIEAQGGAHVNYWLQKKELIKKHDICMLMLGGNNLVLLVNSLRSGTFAITMVFD